jgi:hypothetical protein
MGCSSSPSLTRMAEHFHADREELQIIVNYLIGTEYSTVRIWETDIRDIDDPANVPMFVSSSRRTVSDEYVGEAILHLIQQEGYRGIRKIDGVITFQRWSNLDAGRGIAYSIDGSTPNNEDIFPFLTELEPLPEDGWYFYVDDFNEWRRQNSD